MDVHLHRLAARQDDVVAAWQLMADGWTRRMVDNRAATHGWRALHAGVYVLSRGPVRPDQLWIAATLSTSDSVLGRASAAACWGFRAWHGRFQVVTRPGRGGPRRIGALLVYRSATLDGDVTRHRGIPITTAARTLIDLSPQLRPFETARAFREALRLKTTTIGELEATLRRHRGRRGTLVLRELTQRYAAIPYARTRSDAEALGHEDERKAALWRRAGYDVRRISSDAVYNDPLELLRLTR
jgi:hypothetical protein